MTRKQDQTKEARKIEKQLWDYAIQIDDTAIWEIHKTLFDGSIISKTDIGFRQGNTGIAFFYFELYRATDNEEYLRKTFLIINGIKKVITENEVRHYGFLDGISGYLYLLIHIYHATGEDRHLKSATDLALRSNEFIQGEYSNNSLFEGRAGLLIILINLFSLSQEKGLLNLIKALLDRLILEAELTYEGISWYHSDTQIKSPLGWGTGALGISYALQQSAEFLKAQDLQLLSYESLRYCNKNWQVEMNNWPSFELEVLDQKTDHSLLEEFKQSGKIKAPSSLNTEKGLLGFLVAKALLDFNDQERSYSSKLKKSTAVLKNLSSSNYLDALVSHNLYPNEYPNKVQGDSIGLMEELTGMGLLQLVNSGHRIKEFWRLELDFVDLAGKGSNLELYGSLKHGELLKIIALSKFGRTIEALWKNERNHSLHFEWQMPLKSSALIDPITEAVKKSGDPFIENCLKYEKSKFRLLYKPGSLTCEQHYDKYVAFLKNQELQRKSDKEILDQYYQVKKSVKLVHTRMEINRPDLNDKGTQEPVDYAMLYTDQKAVVIEQKLHDFDELLRFMKKPVKGVELLDNLVNSYGLEDKRAYLAESLIEFLLGKVQENYLEVVS